MLLSEQKQSLRREVKALLRQLSPEEAAAKSEAVWRQVEQVEAFCRANAVLLYASLPGEVQTQDFIRRHGKRLRLLLPVVHGDTLLVGEATGLKRSPQFGILEPTQTLPEIPPIDVAIIPGVAFDRHNNRLGRGKGYYDRLLSAVSAYKIGVCFGCQLLEHVPHNAQDVRMEQVVWA
ncbi:MAG: 5-formyltetrahydrofolate cyclo-ligase [Prevotellaceae bacterium]|jgi:5-formyltetrahydrofolate cyclo-ligase|nr:5-formyltetrahydrofolate cyclo-ligase [Prevotellaceae bacterium]